jgi:aconitate hydratase
MTQVGQDTLGTRSTLSVGGKDYAYYSLRRPRRSSGHFPPALLDEGAAGKPAALRRRRLHRFHRRHEGGGRLAEEPQRSSNEIQYRPARVLLQDFTGVPCVVDLAAMRDAIAKLGGDTSKINPLVPVNLVIDHSVMVDEFGHPKAFEENVEIEYQRNMERYDFLKWGSKSLNNFYAVPPGTGICHQVNLENIAQTVWTSTDQNGVTVAYPDTCVGTDSHTTMVNGLGVLGWGVGGIEAEAAMLGQPVSMLIPEVVGFKFTGELQEGVTATDLVLTATNMLRKHGVVGRSSNIRPGPCRPDAGRPRDARQHGARIRRDLRLLRHRRKTLDYLRLTGREEAQIALVEAYAKEQGFWIDPSVEPIFSSTLELDLSTVVPSLAGPKRPQDRVSLPDVDDVFNKDMAETYKKAQRAFRSKARTSTSATATW